jgi:hypothetical protein
MYGARDVRIENVPGGKLIEPTDVLIRVTRATSPDARAATLRLSPR